MVRARISRQGAKTRRILGHETPESVNRPDAGARTKRPYVFATPEQDAREGIPGTVVTNWVRCGKPGCRCTTGKPHGPYHYHRWREDVYEEVGGSLVPAGRLHRRRYVPRHDAARVLALCQLHRDRRYALRRAMELLSARAMTRKHERLFRLLEEALGW